MTANSDCTAIPTCQKCGTSERYGSGKCKTCQRAARVRHYAKNKGKVKAYLAANKERIAEAGAAYRAANKDEIAKRRAASKDKERITDAARRLRNIEQRRADSAAWRAAHPEAYRIYAQNRRATKRAAGGALSKGLAEKLYVLQKGLCPCCRRSLGNDYHIDHIMPLALGGANIDSNTQLLRADCNRKKHAKHPVDFMQEQGFLI